MTSRRTLRRPVRSAAALALALAALGTPGVVHAVQVADEEGPPPEGLTLPDAAVWRAAAADPTHALPLVVARVDPGLVEGGRLPASVWEHVPPFPMAQHLPVNGAPPSERTEIRMAHDGTAIYFLARMYDRDPDGIQAPSLKRDQIPHTNDFFGVMLDSFLDRETAYGFWTNPAGLRTDVLTQNNASPPGAYNYDYDAFWEVLPERTAEGWRSEMRIPFAALRFHPDDGEVTMGLVLYRRIARKNEWSTFPHIPQRWGAESHFMPSNARPVVFRGVDAPRLFLVSPYVLGGAERRYTPVEEGGDDTGSAAGGAPRPWESSDRGELEAGLDLKVGLSSNLTLDLTVNPDFAQVEADDQQVNLSRFSLFFPEKRQFFQERSAIFDFSFGGSERLFYTRRIGLDEGVPVRIPVGARVAGRAGQWDVGLLNVQTAGTPSGGPGANHGVLRLKRTLLNPNSYTGGMLTTRVDRDGHTEIGYGLDALLRLGESDYLTLQWAQLHRPDESAEDPSGEVPPEGESELGSDTGGFMGSGIARVRLERRGDRGLLFAVDARRVGSRFFPALGFVRRADYVRIGDRVGWGWTPSPEASWTSRTLELSGSALRRSADGVIESAELGPRWSLTTRSGRTLSVSGSVEWEDVDQSFGLPGGNEVPAGSYRFWRVGGRLGSPIGALRGVSLDAEAGSFYDGHSASFGASPRINLSRHVELRGRYQYDRLRFPDRDGGLDAHVARLRVEHQVSTRASWVAFVQYNSATEAVVGNVRFLFSPREGNDLHVVYNTGGRAERGEVDALAPMLDTQTLLVKLSITMGPGS